MHERGQVTPILAVIMLVVALACLGVARVGLAAADRARARTAADAAALAAAADGLPAAEKLARANGARLLDVEQVGSDVIVTVEVGRARATARARRGGGPSNEPRGGVKGWPP